MTTTEDVADVEVPEWKKKALAQNLDANAAPFGMTGWDTEASTSATDATASKANDAHSHEHSHGHS